MTAATAPPATGPAATGPAATNTAPVRLFWHPLSGHCHRVQLMLSLLGRPVELVEIDILAGENRTPSFLARNPLGQVPVIEDGGLMLADSNAILVYLALTYDPARRWLPADAAGAAAVQGWLSLAAGPLVQGPSTARLVRLLGFKADYEQAVATAERLLAHLDRHLEDRAFFVGGGATIADVALYAYVALAPEGGVPLEPYPAVRAWLARIEDLPRFVPMRRTPAAVAA
jgi:glutathione S-transferase